MKRGTEAKVKFKKLERAIGMQTWQVKGLLQSIWDFAAVNAPAGDIGRYPDEEIAIGIGFTDDIAPIIAELVACQWIDEHATHRLVIHHWAEHCEESIHASLARRKLLFADGSMPKTSKLPKAERRAAERELKRLYDKLCESENNSGGIIPPDSAGGGSRHPTGTGTRPKPEPKPRPLPEPEVAGQPAAGVFKQVTTETLESDAALEAWYQNATQRKKPVVQHSDQNRLRVFACAERAIAEAENPPAMFAWMVSGAKWDYITNEYEDRAQDRIRAIGRGPPAESENGFKLDPDSIGSET